MHGPEATILMLTSMGMIRTPMGSTAQTHIHGLLTPFLSEPIHTSVSLRHLADYWGP